MATLSRLLRDLTQSYYSGLSAGTSQRLMRRAVRSYGRLVELIEAGDEEGAAAHWEKQMAYMGAAVVDHDAPISTLSGD